MKKVFFVVEIIFDYGWLLFTRISFSIMTSENFSWKTAQVSVRLFDLTWSAFVFQQDNIRVPGTCPLIWEVSFRVVFMH